MRYHIKEKSKLINMRIFRNFLWLEKRKVLYSAAKAYPDLRGKNLIKGAVIESVRYNQRPGAQHCYSTSVTRVNLAPSVGILLIQLCNIVFFPPPSFNYHYHKMK